jgi:hypothetical protein
MGAKMMQIEGDGRNFYLIKLEAEFNYQENNMSFLRFTGDGIKYYVMYLFPIEKIGNKKTIINSLKSHYC